MVKERNHLPKTLLDPPINHVRDAQTALSPAWLGDPNPADVTRLVRPVQQRTLQPRQKRPGGAQHLFHAATVHACGALVTNNVEQAIARFAGNDTASNSRLVSAALAPRSLAVLRFAVCSRKSLPADASAGPDFPSPCGLAANTNFSWRDLMLQNPSSPSLHPLSRASSLL